MRVTTPLADEIIESILSGSTLTEALCSRGITVGAWHHAMSQDRGLAASYARAQEIRADVLADQALQIADTDEDSQRARNRVQVRQWLASKLHSKRYGDRIDLNVTQVLDIQSTLADARARLLPQRYPVTIEGQVTQQNQGLEPLGASDDQSPAPSAPSAPAPSAPSAPAPSAPSAPAPSAPSIFD